MFFQRCLTSGALLRKLLSSLESCNRRRKATYTRITRSDKNPACSWPSVAYYYPLLQFQTRTARSNFISLSFANPNVPIVALIFSLYAFICRYNIVFGLWFSSVLSQLFISAYDIVFAMFFQCGGEAF